MDKTTHTEALILAAAKKIFLQKGMEGARMQEIADEAGINKALLHYYFRSKEKLFNQIFDHAVQGIFDTINASIRQEQDIYAFIAVFVKKYMAIIRENPFISNFVFNEINRNPERMSELAKFIRLDKAAYGQMIQKNIEEGKMIPVKPEHLLTDLLGMSIFPIVARPLVINYLFNENEMAYENFLNERLEHIVTFFKMALQPKKNAQTHE
jgi:TetR/AcrR family transcriptional regulator